MSSFSVPVDAAASSSLSCVKLSCSILPQTSTVCNTLYSANSASFATNNNNNSSAVLPFANTGMHTAINAIQFLLF